MIDKDGGIRKLRKATKKECARRILDKVEELLSAR